MAGGVGYVGVGVGEETGTDDSSSLLIFGIRLPQHDTFLFCKKNKKETERE